MEEQLGYLLIGFGVGVAVGLVIIIVVEQLAKWWGNR